MWFKSLSGFRLVQPIAYNAEELHELFTPLTIKSLGPYTPNTQGWTYPLGETTKTLAHGVGDCILIAAKKSQKIVPASVVNEKLEEKIAAIEKSEDRKVRAKEKRKLREEILFSLYPQALAQSTVIHAYVDYAKQWLLVDSTNPAAVKTLVTLWERTLPGVKLIPFAVNAQLAHRLAKWLVDEPEGEFDLALDCTLFDPRQSRRTVTFKYQNLSTPEVHAHLETGHLVGQLALNWAERIYFTLDQHLAIRRLRFEEVSSEQFDSVSRDEDPLIRLDTDFALMTGYLRQFVEELIAALGGFVEGKDAAAFLPYHAISAKQDEVEFADD